MIKERIFIGNQDTTALQQLNEWNGTFGAEGILSIQRVEDKIDSLRVFYMEE